jgi:DinB family protein
MTSPERAALIERFGAGPTLVAELAPVAAAVRGGRAPDGWSEREIIAHLVRVDREVFQVRLRDLSGPSEPQWSWVEPGADPGRATLATLVARFGTIRAETIAHLTGLDDAGWARSGVHATYGRLDVAALLGIAIDHDADHIAELERRAG